MADKVNNMERGSAVIHYRCRKIVPVLPKVRSPEGPKVRRTPFQRNPSDRRIPSGRERLLSDEILWIGGHLWKSPVPGTAR